MNKLELVHESTFIIIWVNHEKQILQFTWREGNGDMSEAEFKQTILLLLNLSLAHDLQRQLADLRLFSFPITPDLQVWGYENHILQYQKLTKLACLMPEDLIGRLGLEQVQDEFTTSTYVIRNFDLVEDAEAWLCA
jgi:hypothetical protein